MHESIPAKFDDRLMMHFLERAGVDPSFLENKSNQANAFMPDLCQNNPRLLELRRLYHERRTWPDEHSIWKQEFISNDLPLDRFRMDCAYIWQKRDFNSPASFVLTFLYLETLGLGSLLRELGEDGAFGCFTQPVNGTPASRDLLDSVCEINFLRRMLGEEPLRGKTILDIGAGYGRLAHRMFQAGHSGRIFCTDAIPESAFLSEFYIKYRNCPDLARMITLPDLFDTIKPAEIDIAINIHCFSECPYIFIGWWLRLIAKLEIPCLFIVPNSDSDGGRSLLSTERNGARIDYSVLVHAAGYRRVALEPKYADASVQRFGISPTHYHFFKRIR